MYLKNAKETRLSLFEIVREDCSKQTWSEAVKLVRANGVSTDSQAPNQQDLLVLNADTGVSNKVKLWIEDEDWKCDCNSHEDPCKHVAAAVIALRQAKTMGKNLKAAENTTARIEYHFFPKQEGALFQRRVVWSGGYEVLAAKLNDPNKLRVKGHAVTPQPIDLKIDKALLYQSQGIIDRNSIKTLLKALYGCDRVFFDNKVVEVLAEPMGLVCDVIDHHQGVHIKGRLDPNILSHYKNGLAVTHEGVAYMRSIDLPANIFRMLKDGHYFSADELGQLASIIIPKIKEQARIINQSTNLPSIIRAKVRIGFKLEPQIGEEIAITPEIVYGTPEIAVVRDGKLVLKGLDSPLRDPEAERDLNRQLYTKYGLSCGETITKTRTKALTLIEEINKTGLFHIQDEGGRKTFEVYSELMPNLSTTNHGFNLTFTSEGSSKETKTATIKAVSEAFRKGDQYVSLVDGGFAPLPTSWLQKFGSRVFEILETQDEAGQLPRGSWPTAAALAQDLDMPMPSPVNDLRDRLIKGKQKGFELHSEFQAQLRPYQKDGVNWLHFLREIKMGALLADDMGLGKTLQTIAIMQGPTLVVCPTSVLPNWIAEIKKFAPYLNPVPYHGVSRSLSQPSKNDVIITSFGLLRLDQNKLLEHQWETMVIDEAQNIKNPKSQVSKAAAAMNAQFRIALTGTPVENRLDDLYSQFHFLNPGMLGTYRGFQTQYVNPIEKGEPGPALRLKNLISPFIMRRLKDDVLDDLPPKTENELHIELSQEEKEAYQGLLAATKKEVLEKLGAGSRTIEMLELLLRLRQAACALDLLPGQEDVDNGVSSKTQVLLDKLDQVAEDGHKALVFSQWTSYLDILEDSLKKSNTSYIRLDGSSRNRGEIVERFQSQEGPTVLLMSLKAGGVGLNLTAADHVFIMDPWWNPAAEDQAADRAHRMGQNRPVMIYRLITKDTVEERIMLLKEKKRNLADEMLAGATQTAITREDILDLLS